MVSLRQALIAAVSAVTVVRAGFNEVNTDMVNVHNLMQSEITNCNNWNGACTSFFLQNDGWYQVTQNLVQAKIDTINSAVFTVAEATTLTNYCNNQLYGDYKYWQACVVNKKNFYVGINAKYTVCQQIKAMTDAVDAWMPYFYAKMPTSALQSAATQCKNGLDLCLNYAKQGLGAPCP